jgi:putative hydrolase of the HAD superfamily
MAFRAVLLDFFNTLTTAVQRGPRHADIARSLGCDPRVWIEVLNRTYPARSRGGYGSAEDGLCRLAREAGGNPTDAEVSAAVQARIVAVREDAPLRAEVAPLLWTLRRMGVRTAVVSDCWFEVPAFLPRMEIAPLINAYAFSVDVGAAKPHPSMYLTACDRLDVVPRDCLYVGDGGSHELTGAQLLGMTAVRLDAPDLGDHLTFNADLGWTGPCVDSLDGIPQLVDNEPVPTLV